MAFNHVGQCECPVGCCDCGSSYTLDDYLRDAAYGSYIHHSHLKPLIERLTNTYETLRAMGLEYALAYKNIAVIVNRLQKDLDEHEQSLKPKKRRKR